MKVQDFIGGEDTQRSLNLSDNKCINLVPTTNNNGQITAFYKVDGLKQEAVLSGIPTGAYKTSTGRSFYVTGITLYELNTDLTSTSRGTVTAGSYSFSDNGIELICVNGTDGWLLVLATNVLSQIKVLTGTVTITVANPAVITKTAHGLAATDRVLFSTTGILPDGLTTSTPYYVIAGGLTADAFEVSETLAGTAIATTLSGLVSCTPSTFVGTVAEIVSNSYRTNLYPLSFGDVIQFQTSGTLPTGLSLNTDYYVTGRNNVTFTIASPCVVTTIDYNFTVGQKIIFYTNGTLPTGIEQGTIYYVTAPVGLTFQIASSLANALAGTGINTGGVQAGSHTFLMENFFCLSSSEANMYSSRIQLTSGYAGNITYTQQAQYGTHTYLSSGYGFPNGCETVSYMNGRFIACEPNTQNYYISEPLDGGYWDALNVQTVDSNPDYVVGQVVSHNELIVFCETSGEVFYDSGTIPTPFVRNSSGVFEVGCLAPFSIAKLDNSVFWLGQSDEGKGCVYRLNGYNPVKISSYSIEQQIQAMTTISDAAAFSYQKDGHHFYVLTFPTSGKTFVFDANTNLWHERASFIESTFGRWEPKDHLFFNSKHYVTDALSTNLYSLDSATYSNGTNPCKILRSFKSPSSDMKRVRHNVLEVEGEFGIGSSAGSDPQLMIRWSDDNHTWSNLKTRSLGKVGEYGKRLAFKRLGITKRVPRVYEISCSEDVKVTLLNVYLE